MAARLDPPVAAEERRGSNLAAYSRLRPCCCCCPVRKNSRANTNRNTQIDLLVSSTHRSAPQCNCPAQKYRTCTPCQEDRVGNRL
eukprot:6434672-Prymnesium_polylepis.1